MTQSKDKKSIWIEVVDHRKLRVLVGWILIICMQAPFGKTKCIVSFTNLAGHWHNYRLYRCWCGCTTVIPCKHGSSFDELIINRSWLCLGERKPAQSCDFYVCIIWFSSSTQGQRLGWINFTCLPGRYFERKKSVKQRIKLVCPLYMCLIVP